MQRLGLQKRSNRANRRIVAIIGVVIVSRCIVTILKRHYATPKWNQESLLDCSEFGVDDLVIACIDKQKIRQ